MSTKISELEKLEELIRAYKLELDNKKKHVAYLRLVEEAMSLVKKIVAAFYPLPNTITKDDLIQVGAVGLLKAIDSYRLEERGSFKTYAGKMIKGRIFHYLRDKANLVKPPRETLENMSKVKHAIDVLSENSPITPSIEMISQYLNMPCEKIEEIMNLELLKNMVSLDQNSFFNEEGDSLLDRIQIEDSNFEETYANKKILEFAINKLPEIDKIAICKYYIEGESRKTVSEILKVSPTQVSRILKRALNKLYKIIQNEQTD